MKLQCVYVSVNVFESYPLIITKVCCRHVFSENSVIADAVLMNFLRC